MPILNFTIVLKLTVLVAVVAYLSWLMVGRLIIWLQARQIVDTPNERTIHQGSIARGGGLVIIGLLFITQLVLAVVTQRHGLFGGFAILLLAWGGLSWWDDQHDLSARKRLVIQLFLSAFILLAFGYVAEITVATESVIWLGLFGALASFIGIMWFTNLYNFMDGLDGLAVSQTIMASLTMAIWFFSLGDFALALSCLVLAAASYGFLLWNWHPAKIFMGDVGSITIGAFFATLIIIGNNRYQIPVLSFVLLFGVFILDASVTILRRATRMEKIWLPHRSHYYQRLVCLGVNHSKLAIILIMLMMLCSIIGSITVLDHDRIGLAIIAELLMFVVAVFVVKFKESRTQING